MSKIVRNAFLTAVNAQDAVIFSAGDAAGVHIIGSRHDWQIPKIFIFTNLQIATPKLAEIVAHLD